MLRRGLSLALLALLAVELLGGLAFACPDDGEEFDCAPVCAICTSCAHTQSTPAQSAPVTMPFASSARFTAADAVSQSSLLAADIFHVPLRG